MGTAHTASKLRLLEPRFSATASTFLCVLKEKPEGHLDPDLNGTLSYPIAEVIRERGIPVIFATGYGADGVLDRFSDCPTLQKPFSQQDFAEAVAAACQQDTANHCDS